MDTDVTVKWLGISGVEVAMGEERILIDPVFSRVKFARTLLGRIEPDADAVRARAAGCRGVFITHAHHDHLMDAPLLSVLTGSPVYGSENTCAVARACGADEALLHPVLAGEETLAGPFSVVALPAGHIRLPGFGAGPVRPGLAPPLRARQYRMDGSFVFLVRVGGWRLLVGPGPCLADPGEIDALLCCPLYLMDRLGEYIESLKPAVFLPIHWDDMFRTDAEHPLPGRLPRRPLHRLDMERVGREAQLAGTHYLLPEINRAYRLSEIACQDTQVLV